MLGHDVQIARRALLILLFTLSWVHPAWAVRGQVEVGADGVALYATDTVTKTGTGSTYVTNAAPTVSSPVLTIKVNMPRVSSLPSSPQAGDTVIVTDDSSVGACDSTAGTFQSLCQWNGTQWVSLGDGGAGGSLSGLTTNTIPKATSATTIGNGCVTDNGTIVTVGCANGITTGTGSVAGRLEFMEGTATGLVANTVSYYAPVDVAVGGIAFVAPGAAATGLAYYTNAAGVMTESIVTFYDEVWRDAAGCNNATAGTIWNNNTANPPAYACEGTNTRLATADFDATTDEGFDGSFRLPTGFTGAIDAIFRWKAAATSGAVGWCLQLVRVPTGATSDPSLPAQASGNCVSSTVAGTTLQEVEATISGVTCTSCAAGDRVNFRVSRDADGGAVTDSMTGDGKLIGWMTRIRRTL